MSTGRLRETYLVGRSSEDGMKKVNGIPATNFEAILKAIEEEEIAIVQMPEGVFGAPPLLKRVDRRLRSPIDLGEDPPRTMFPSRLTLAPHLARRVVQWRADKTAPPVVLQDGSLLEHGASTCAALTQWSKQLVMEFSVRYSVPPETAKALLCTDYWVLNAIHYPSLPDHQDEMRFPAHRDWGLFACYPAIQGVGLEVLLQGKWHPVRLAPGQMLVYAGMAATFFVQRLMRASSLRAASHRVMQRTNHGRSTLIYYIDPVRDLALPDGRPFGQFLFEQRQKIGQ